MQTIYLDISNKGVIPCIHAKQSEVGRKFLAVITDNGVPYNIPDNSLLSVWYEGDTDAGNYSSIEEKSAFSIDGNKVSVELVAQMLLKPGKGEMCLSITHGDGGETNTWNIPYDVEYKPGAGSAVPTEYYTALTEAGAVAAENATSAKKDAEIAKSYGSEILLSVYPVGSIYLSVNDVDPSALFGGTWQKIKDRFLLSSGDIYENGSVGGEATHTLTVDEMPSHTHSERIPYTEESGNLVTAGVLSAVFDGADAAIKKISAGTSVNVTSATALASTWSSGAGKAHNIMPPYLAVNMWKRTA